MRELFIAILTLGLGAGAQASIIGTTYTDATNDLFDSSLTNLDLVSARISNDATHLHLSVTVRGDVSTTTWGDYMVFIDSTTSLSASERDDAEGSRGNPFHRGIAAPDGGGNLNYTFEGGRWNQKETGTPDLTRATSGTVNWTFSLESLGLAIGDTFHFDVATIGSSDGSSSVDLLSTSSIRPGWGFDEDSTLDLTYTVAGSTAVPGIGGVAALAGLGLARRRRTR
jgi:hypothetical protein